MRKIKELIIEKSLLTSALITIAITFEIILVFIEVSILDFFTDTQWTPLFTDKHYGILPLLSVTLPIGLSIS